jgi:hypothetical protein
MNTLQVKTETAPLVVVNPELAKLNPAQTDNHLEASLRKRFGGLLSLNSLEGRKFLDLPVIQTGIQEVKSLMARSMQPAPDEMIVAALAECAALCCRKADGDEMNDAAVRAYVARLRSVPADCALTALKDWPNRNKFFPTWHELQSEINKLARYRLVLQVVVQKSEGAAK